MIPLIFYVEIICQRLGFVLCSWGCLLLLGITVAFIIVVSPLIFSISEVTMDWMLKFLLVIEEMIILPNDYNFVWDSLQGRSGKYPLSLISFEVYHLFLCYWWLFYWWLKERDKLIFVANSFPSLHYFGSGLLNSWIGIYSFAIDWVDAFDFIWYFCWIWVAFEGVGYLRSFP